MEELDKAASFDENRYLAPHVYAAELDAGAVLLDLRSLQYYALDVQSLATLRGRVTGLPAYSSTSLQHETTTGSPESLLDSLERCGFLARTPPHRRFSPTSVTPQSACQPVWSIRASRNAVLLMLYRLTWAYLITLIHLRAQRLTFMLTRLARSAHNSANRSAAPSTEGLASLVTLYAKVRVWLYTAKSRCLLDSLVFVRVLRKYDIPATMTIGVTAKPFAAHAWVQVHDCVLDDTVEHVREFTPILMA